MAPDTALPAETALPPALTEWFARRRWTPRRHQLEMVAAARAGRPALLIAPTGAGKTLAGFLPSLVELATDGGETRGLHTLYISPLKALAVDVHRNLTQPIEEMGLAIRAETRTGDTPQGKRQRQQARPPHILMTTPESLALLLSYPNARRFFAGLRAVVLDELHALAGTKRGDLLALGLARLRTLAPDLRTVGLSATVADEPALIAWLSRQADRADPRVALVRGDPGAEPVIEILATETRLPWSGHMAAHALPEIFERIRQTSTAIVFVNTRAQAEIIFQGLWRLNEETLPIGLHHGSLAVEQRRRVEAAMARGALRAVVATSSLDLGIDWGAVDLVIQVGAPKGSSRLLQRVGRANHRLDTPSRALLVPGNRFEYLECLAARQAVEARTLDGAFEKPGALDVLAQHITGLACSEPFAADALFTEVRSASPYADLSREDFDRTLGFVADGGYALGAYDRYKRLRLLADGTYMVAGPAVVRRYRMNIGTIVESPMIKVRLGRGKVLGEVEEWFVQGLSPGDTFVFSGQLLRFEGMREMSAQCSRATGDTPTVPAYGGGRMPLSTHLADRVRGLLADPDAWAALPGQVAEWLRLQQWRSVLPGPEGLLVETFPRGGKRFLVAYCFEGRNAHQTLGMLLTRRMERAGLGPLGFVATDYVLAIWSLREAGDMDALFDEDMLGDDLEAWMGESAMLKRTFRRVAVIAGLIERRLPGHEKSGRQVTFNADLIYDVLRGHEPDHILLRATWADAATGLTDVGRIADLLRRAKGRLRHRRLDRVSPLAVPVLLEIGREPVQGGAVDELLDGEAEALIAEAMAPPGTQGAML